MILWLEKIFGGFEEVDRALRHPPAAQMADPALHDEIMRAVRGATAETPPRRKATSLWLMPWGAAISAAAISLGLWLWPAAEPRSAIAPNELAQAPGAALEMGARAPGLFLAPLTNELARVDHDIHNTTEVLLADFP